MKSDCLVLTPIPIVLQELERQLADLDAQSSTARALFG